MTVPLLLKPPEAAALIGIERQLLDKLRKKGLVAAVRADPDSSRVYYRREDIEAYIAGLEVTP